MCQTEKCACKGVAMIIQIFSYSSNRPTTVQILTNKTFNNERLKSCFNY